MIINTNSRICEVSRSLQIEVDNDVLWGIISSPGNLNYCHPYCKENNVEKWQGIDSRDSITYYNGLTLNREFIDWNEKKGYELNIGKRKLAAANVLWEINAINNNASTLSISIKLYSDVILFKYLKVFRNMITYFFLKPKMSAYINAVLRGFKHYAETTEPVQKNQFGYNSIFSTKNK